MTRRPFRVGLIRRDPPTPAPEPMATVLPVADYDAAIAAITAVIREGTRLERTSKDLATQVAFGNLVEHALRAGQALRRSR